MGTRILTVEDDERIRTAVNLALEDEGWVVDEASSGEEALQSFSRHASDVVLIDIMLPGIDGFEVCRSIRRSSDVPIIMVTARADTHDVVAGLEAGADDYLTKPFAPKELSARIRALLRRVRSTDPNMPRLVFGELEIAPEEGVVRKNGEELHLTKTEFRLLVELAQNPGRVLSREALLERVWGYGYFGDGRLVDVHVRRLRTKVDTVPSRRPRQPQGRSCSQGSPISGIAPAQPARSRHPHLCARWVAHVRLARERHVVSHSPKPAAETRSGRAQRSVRQCATSERLPQEGSAQRHRPHRRQLEVGQRLHRPLSEPNRLDSERMAALGRGRVRRERRPAQVAGGRRRRRERVDPHR
ncbi:MAG: response regulator transcription factor [Actinobacteria bacterium]|nr:MAG: response regulator transcription factor [Actinomycetota bacterium]